MGRGPLSYHITAPANWLNDPNGPLLWEGRYHLFYQHNPLAPRWGSPRWGHVSSANLVHWEHHPIALAPTAGQPDADGCWSGCTRIIDGQPTIYYTGVVGDDDQRVETVCRALSTDHRLLRWRPDPANPLIAGPPAALGPGPHRDPFLFREGHRWRMLLGTTVRGSGGPVGAVIQYRSHGATGWSYGGVLLHGDHPMGPPGPLWECPQLLDIGGQHVLIVSTQDPTLAKPLRYAAYLVGTLDERTFTPHRVGRIDHGDLLYAPTVLSEPTGRHLLWGWIQELLDEPAASAAHHVGALSLPRTLSLLDGQLMLGPARELTALRRGTRRLEPSAGAPPTEPHYDFRPSSTHWELEITLDRDGDPVVLDLLDGEATQGVRLTAHRPAGAAYFVPLTDGPVPGQALQDLSRAPLPDEPVLTIRVFVDHGVIEAFVDDRAALTTRLPGHAERVGKVELGSPTEGEPPILQLHELSGTMR